MKSFTAMRLGRSAGLLWPFAGWGDDLAGRPASAAPPFDAGLLSNTLLALLVVLALIGAMLWALRRLGQSRITGSGVLRVVAGLPLGMRERVVLMQAGDTRLLLGITPGRIETLHVFPASGTQETGVEASQDFRGQLTAAIKGAKNR